MLNFKQFFLLGFIWGILGICSIAAQSQLERISITERGDGNGYVLRYHLTEMVDSYDLIQPEINRVQMQLFSPGLNAAEAEMPEMNEEIIGLELIQLNGGIGVEITSAENLFFTAETYPDQNMRDLLVNLEYASQADVEAVTLESEPYEWSVIEETPPEPIAEEQPESEETDPPTELEDEEPEPVVQREPVSVRIGITGGIGIANKLGGDYTAGSRQDFLMGISAGITFPFVLPYSIKTGIETGIFYTQKGFLNPSANRFDGETVLLDYVEVPVLVRLHYDVTPMIKPKIVGGIYSAFRANAEVLQNDGDRIDLNENTKAVDIGLMAGVGSDFLIQSTSISLQVRYGVSISPIFKGNFSGNERLGYLSLMAGFRF
ncbi:outer membrane beta-barrel protein [Rhodohalobacter sulfatireducens]|uniref:PorT family protein n=1 Tax=Rhodohalobacter sulfatireducens TaxID=2911366 RepID=A0ABS9K856_9BACT|nr:outer membrane beta-barrel protein [Rhodohalobacter sulfatireducens]MCG2587038.1 PorT family protein [Rhodohalobacter sulfatireducens]